MNDGVLYKVSSYMMVGLGVLNMILVIVKSSIGASETENDIEEDIEGIQTLGQGLPSFLILNNLTRN